MRLLVALCVLGIVGCDKPAVSVCSTPELTIEYEFEADCVAMSDNVQLIKALLGYHNVASEEWLSTSVGNVSIRVRAETSVHAENKVVMGATYKRGRDYSIELARDGKALAHEILHVYDWPNAEHQNWESRGFLKVTRAFETYAKPVE
jgi:hypothetical protein